MSDATLQAVHDAIAAHVADINEDDPEYLTEWAFVAATAVSTEPDSTCYYYADSSVPYHHARGLLDWAQSHVHESRLTAMGDED
jgi:hypothetical protein